MSTQASRHLLAIINDVLDISRIEADQLTLEEKTFSLSQTIDEVLLMQNEQALAKGLHLSRDIAPALPDLLCGDALRLKQILLNFVGNGLKFSGRGRVSVRAFATDEDDHSLTLRIEVTDEGIGLSTQQQMRLFRVFSQVDDSSTRRYGGSGLGLVISKRLAKLMGGDVGVTSELGVGSTFWMTARLKRAMLALPQVAAGSTLPQHALALHFGGHHVLVAEDDPAGQELVWTLLTDAGLKVDMVSNGARQCICR
jgi:signal transduction histidine kinase